MLAEDKPIDIWNIDKKEIESIKETNISSEKIDAGTESSIYDMQADKKKRLYKIRSKTFL